MLHRDPFALQPGSRPGERMVAGRPYAYDLDELSDWLAVDAKRAAPDDLAPMPDDELTALWFRALRLFALSGHRDGELLRRVEAERARRPHLVAAYGEAA